MTLVVNPQTNSITVEDLIENLSRISGDISEVVSVLKTKVLTGTINIPSPQRRTRRRNTKKKVEVTALSSVPASAFLPLETKTENPKGKPKKQYKQKVKPLFTE